MKAIFSKVIKTGVLATLCLTLLVTAPLLSFAQNKKEKKDRIRMRVEHQVDGKTKVYEKDIDATGLSESQRENIIQKFQDSVSAENKGKSHGMKVEVESYSGDEKEGMKSRSFSHSGDDNDHFSFEGKGNNDDEIVIRDRPRVRVYRRDGKEDEDFMKDFHWEMDGLRNNMKQLGKDFNKDFNFNYRTIPDVFTFDGGSSSKTVRGLDVYPNNPKTEVLNLRFHSTEKGEVNIKVLDVKGNVIAKEDIKDFSGEYVGQINIGKQKGVVFVMVTQGEDGTVKRVSLPEN